MRRFTTLAVWTLCLVLWGAEAIRLPAQTPSQELYARNSPMIGQTAPSWSTQGWVNSEPLDVSKLRGKVVLLRFLNDNPNGAASLNQLYRTYRARGMTVVGMFTPQPMPGEVSLDHVRELASTQGFEFPVGLDSRWETLNRYWLQQADADSTATTFLIDRKGVIRYIQPDGKYEKDSRNRAMRKEYATLENEIETLLKPEEETSGKTTEEHKATH